jgi:hypothetical protein
MENSLTRFVYLDDEMMTFNDVICAYISYIESPSILSIMPWPFSLHHPSLLPSIFIPCPLAFISIVSLPHMIDRGVKITKVAFQNR